MDDSFHSQNSSSENEGNGEHFHSRRVPAFASDGSPTRSESSLSSPSSSSSLYSSSRLGSSLVSQRSSACSSLAEEDLSLLSRMNLRDREGRTIHGAGKETLERIDEPLWYSPRFDVNLQAVMQAPEQVERGKDVITTSNLDTPSAQKVSEFSREATVIPPLFPVRNLSLPRTLIHVYSERKINFAESIVPFMIHVINPPLDMELHPRMFQAMVETPNGRSLPCRIRATDNFILNSFYVSFKSDESFGTYEAHVRMIIPMDFWARYKNLAEYSDGVIHGSTKIPVSRNYGAEAQRDCLSIQCNYVKVENRQPRNLQRRRGKSSATDEESSEAGAVGGLEEEQSQQEVTTSSVKTPQVECKLWGLTCDMRNNNLLYTDRESHHVHCISPRGDILFTFGRVPGTPLSQQLHRPCGITYDEAHQRLIVCDKDNHRICFFTLDGHFISSFGQRGYKNGFFEYPWDVAVSRDGQAIVVADSKNKRIQLFDRFGNYLNKYTVFEVNPFEYRAQFDCPRSLCFDDTMSNIFVTDFHVNNVIKIPVDCSRHEKLLPYGTVFRPQGIQMDCVGNLLVVDSRHDCLRHMNTRGEHLSTIREVIKQPLSFPINVTTMAGGFVAMLNGNGSITIF